jgi:hypothetical protein
LNGVSASRIVCNEECSSTLIAKATDKLDTKRRRIFIGPFAISHVHFVAFSAPSIGPWIVRRRNCRVPDLRRILKEMLTDIGFVAFAI